MRHRKEYRCSLDTFSPDDFSSRDDLYVMVAIAERLERLVIAMERIVATDIQSRSRKANHDH